MSLQRSSSTTTTKRQLGLLQDQVEPLALVRDASISSAEFRALLELNDDGRRVVADVIARTARAEAERLAGGQGGTSDNS